MTDQELREEIRQGMLRETYEEHQHEIRMRDDVEYCIDSVMTKELI